MQNMVHEKTAISLGQTRVESDLVALATPVLELVMQIKAGFMTPSKDLRRTVDERLKEIEQSAEALGHKERQAQAVKFALVAFIDETVLTADSPLREEWEKRPLQLEYFDEQLAGVKFFERLDQHLKDIDSDADVVEVYYLCLLLGYKGKYKRYYENKLEGVIENVADHLRRTGRLRGGALSPHWKANDQPEVKPDPGLSRWVTLGGGVALGFVLLVFIIFSFLLSRDLNEAMNTLLR